MAYAPNPNLFRPLVLPDTQGMAPGLAAVGQSLAQGIEKYASNRAAVKAADSEFDMFQQMYPDTAALMDSEKFASANLAGKQKMLGLAKGYIIEQREQLQNAQTNAFRGAELGLRGQQLNNQVMQTNQGFALDSQRQNTQAQQVNQGFALDAQRQGTQAQQVNQSYALEAQRLAQAEAAAAANQAYQDRVLALKEKQFTAEELTKSLGGRVVPIVGTDMLRLVDRYGNGIPRTPLYTRQPGSYAGEAPLIAVPNSVAGTPAAARPTVQDIDGYPHRLSADGNSWVKLPITELGAPAAVDALDKVFE